MILPFVREIFADVEKSPAFVRAVAHGQGRRGAYPCLRTDPDRQSPVLLPCCVMRPASRWSSSFRDNRTVEELLPVVRSLGELTGAVAPDEVVGLPAYDVLPFENQSPHPEIQENRATALWKIATGTASVVITPLASTAMRLHDADVLRRPGEGGAPRRDDRARAADRAPAPRGLQPGGRGRDAGRVRASRRAARRVFAGVGPPGAHRVVRRRG